VGEACRAAVADAVATGVAKTEILGIAFDGTCSLVVLDADGAPLSVSPNDETEQNVVVWCDHRALAEAEEMTASGHALLRYVGGVMSPEMQPPKLLWLKRNCPRSWERAGKFFDLCDWLAFAATGYDVRSLCSNVCKWAYIGHEDRWDEEFYATVGLDGLIDGRRVGRNIQPPGKRIGVLSTIAAAHLGLGDTVSVGVGAIDAHAGGIGVLGGTPVSGTALALIAGTSVCHMALCERPTFIRGVWGPYHGAMLENLWLMEGGQSAAGSLIDAAANSSDAAVHERICAAAVALAASERLVDVAELVRHVHVLDYHLGNRSPFADPRARGVLDGLSLAPDPNDNIRIYVATLCAVAYGTRAIIDALNGSVDGADGRGFHIERLFGTGGLCKNSLWLQIAADATGLPIILGSEPESVLLGSSILGAVACSLHDNVGLAMAAMGRTGRVIEPKPAARAFHDRKYAVYQRLYATSLANRKTMDEGAT
jgi:FGGY-family pentulose kinase